MKTTSEDFSIVAKGLTIDGTVSCKGKLMIKGTVKGKLDAETVIIAEEGSVYANTKVGSISIGGIFEGEIEASDQLIVCSTGKCSGKVTCKDLVVEEKGILNAAVISTADKESEPEKAFSVS